MEFRGLYSSREERASFSIVEDGAVSSSSVVVIEVILLSAVAAPLSLYALDIILDASSNILSAAV